MATRKDLIRSIGNCRVNGIGADLYTTTNGGVMICFDKNGRVIHRAADGSLAQVEFASIDEAEDFLDSIPHAKGNGFQLVQGLKDRYL